MGYRLAIDMGTTFTAAAAVQVGQVSPSMHELGNRAVQIPSVLYLQEDGRFLVGEAAERRGATDPSRVVREFKRRIGDRVPLRIASTPFTAQILSAELLSWVVASATERLGSPPDQVVLTYPATWGTYKRRLFEEVIALADIGTALTCPEPVAAAIHYAAESHLEIGSRLAVYDLGGGTFDVCVVERTDSGFEILGTPEGVEQLGGVDFDEAVFEHAVDALDPLIDELDPDSPEGLAALTRLRRECVEAKEALSTDVVAVIPVALPGRSTSVRLTRSEFEGLIAPDLERTVDATARALQAADTTSEQLAAIVLVGGSSRIPLVSHLLQARFGVSPARNTHPKYDVALGAAEYQAAPVRPSAEPADASPPPPEPSAAGPIAGPLGATLISKPLDETGTSEPVDATLIGEPLDAAGTGEQPGTGPTGELPDAIPPEGTSRPALVEWITGLSPRSRQLAAVGAAMAAVVVVALIAVLLVSWGGRPNAGGPAAAHSSVTASSRSAPPVGVGSILGMAVSSDGRHAYLTSSNSNLISVVDPSTKATIKKIPVGSGPLGIAVNEDDNRVYAVSSGAGTITRIDEKSLTVVGRPIRVGRQPQSVVLRPGREVAYVTNFADDTVSVVDLGSWKVVETIPVGDGPRNLAIDSAAHRLYVANQNSATVSVISISTNSSVGAPIRVPKNPNEMAVSAATDRLYLTHKGSNTISVIDTATRESLGDQITLSAEPLDLALGHRGSRLYATLRGADAIAVIETGATPSVGEPIHLREQPARIEVSDDSTHLYVSENTGTVTVVPAPDETTTSATPSQPPSHTQSSPPTSKESTVTKRPTHTHTRTTEPPPPSTQTPPSSGPTTITVPTNTPTF